MKKAKIVVSLLTSVCMFSSLSAINASAVGVYYDAYRENNSGNTSYRGVGVADGSTYKVVSGYITTTSGNVYASGNTKHKITGWVSANASGGNGQFTFSHTSNGSTYNFNVNYS